ncbi:hypothetical protein NADFUDRAFT_11589, partial [Nadsonia fulvescens var. elongata DSM 6958]
AAMEFVTNRNGEIIPKTFRLGSRIFSSIYMLSALMMLRGPRGRQYQFDSRLGVRLNNRDLIKMSVSTSAIITAYRLVYRMLIYLSKESIGGGAGSGSRVILFLKRLLTWNIQKLLSVRLVIPVFTGLLSSGFFLFYPKCLGRDYIALYTFMKALDGLYNHYSDRGYLSIKSKWIGSWMLFPLAYGQLFYTFFFNRESCPGWFFKVMTHMCNGFMPPKNDRLSHNVVWPTSREVVEGIADIAKERYPKFVSPIMYPASALTLNKRFPRIAPIIASAHPMVRTMTGALIHANEPSDFEAFIRLTLKQFGSIGKILMISSLVTNCLQRRKELSPEMLVTVIGKSLRTTIFAVMTLCSSWYGIGLSQQVLPRNILPVYRFKLIGTLAGLWAIIDASSVNRARYMYMFRIALMSLWRELVSNKKVKPIKNGDVALFMCGFTCIMALMEYSPTSISGKQFRKALQWMRTGRFEEVI